MTVILARLLTALADFCLDAWYTFRPGVNEFWDNVPYAYRTLVPAETAALGDLPKLRCCKTCRARVGAPCSTAEGKVMHGFHKARKAASTRLADAYPEVEVTEAQGLLPATELMNDPSQEDDQQDDHDDPDHQPHDPRQLSQESHDRSIYPAGSG